MDMTRENEVRRGTGCRASGSDLVLLAVAASRHSHGIHVAVLGLIILIRSFLSVTLHLQVESRWPWQSNRQATD